MEHDYTITGGLNRANVGRYLSVAAASISSVIVLVILWSVDVAKRLDLPVNVPPSIMSLIGAGTVFAVLYWLLNKYAWKWPILGLVLKVPDISGRWQCVGQTINVDGTPGFVWQAEITIVQTWDKLRVRLKTQQSASNSESAAMICDEADGYRLFYSYRNEPRIGETDLASHRGFAELVFKKDLQSAEGEYFNGHGRYTFGTMRLNRL